MGAALRPGSASLLDPLGVCANAHPVEDDEIGKDSGRARPSGRGGAAGRARRARRRHPADAVASEPRDRRARRNEELTLDIFNLHDLNGNGLLEEQELVQLNETIAVLHHGTAVNIREVRSRFKAVFRAGLDPQGRPVPFENFRRYEMELLDALDPDPQAQEMILEQFVAEAQSGRRAMELWHEGGGATDLLSALSDPAPAVPGTRAGGGAVQPAGPPLVVNAAGS